MWYSSKRRHRAPGLAIFSLAIVLLSAGICHAQTAMIQGPVVTVSPETQKLKMVVGTSRVLTIGQVIPRVQVNNPDILDVQALSPTKVQLSAKKPGVTQVNLWDKQDNIISLDVYVFADARELTMLLREEFPTASLEVKPLASSVILSGFVEQPEQVSRVIRMAEDFYPKVIPNITVGGVQQVLLHVKLMEVSRTKLRTLGVDFGFTNGSDFVVQSVSGLISAADAAGGAAVGAGDTVRFGLVNGNAKFFGFIEALQQNDLAKILAEPTLVTVSGRPANFMVGGQIPIIVPQSLGTVSIEYKDYGTQVDFVPIVQGNGWIRLEVRPQVSELDDARGVTINNTVVPALTLRKVDTGVNMRAGQTLALAGLVQNRIDAETKGLPYLSDMPYVGSMFRRVTETNNEVELLILVTPELVSSMDPHQVPPCGPGSSSQSPSDWDLYARGHIEMPSTGPCGPQMNCACHGPTPIGMSTAPSEEDVPLSPQPQQPNQPQQQNQQPQQNQPQQNQPPQRPQPPQPMTLNMARAPQQVVYQEAPAPAAQMAPAPQTVAYQRPPMILQSTAADPQTAASPNMAGRVTTVAAQEPNPPQTQMAAPAGPMTNSVAPWRPAPQPPREAGTYETRSPAAPLPAPDFIGPQGYDVK